MGSYMDNWKKGVSRGPLRLEDRLYALTWCGDEGLSEPKDDMEPLVDAPNDTGKFVVALEGLRLRKKLFGVSDLVRGKEFMEVWCRELGVEGSHKYLSEADLMVSVPNKDFADFAKTVFQSRANHAEFGWLGGEEC
jgi:hypothetical protein